MIFKSIVAGAMTVFAVTVVYVFLIGPTSLAQASPDKILPLLLDDPEYLVIAVASFFFGFYCMLQTTWPK